MAFALLAASPSAPRCFLRFLFFFQSDGLELAEEDGVETFLQRGDFSAKVGSAHGLLLRQVCRFVVIEQAVNVGIA